MANVSRGLRCEGMEVFRLRELRNDCCPHSLGAKPVGDEPAAIERGATPPVGQGVTNRVCLCLREHHDTGRRLNTVNVIDSSVLDGSVQWKVPQGQVNPNEIRLTWKTLSLGLRFNLGAISQAQAVLQAKGQRLVARSGLLPNVNAAVSEELEKLNLRTQGVESSTFPVTAEFNFFDARAARLNQTIFDLVKIENLHSASDTLRASLNSARNAHDLIVLAVAGSYVQLIATQARISAAKAQVETSRTIYQQAADSGLMSTIFGTWLFFARYAFPLRSSSKSQLRVQRVLVSKSRSIGRMQRTDKAPFIEDTGILIDPWHGRGHRFDPIRSTESNQQLTWVPYFCPALVFAAIIRAQREQFRSMRSPTR